MLVISEEEFCSLPCTHLQHGVVERMIHSHWVLDAMLMATDEQQARKQLPALRWLCRQGGGAVGTLSQGAQRSLQKHRVRKAGRARPSPQDQMYGTSELVKRRLLTGTQWEL